MTFLGAGRMPDRKTVSEEMPWKKVKALASQDDPTALCAYLHGLPPVEDPARRTDGKGQSGSNDSESLGPLALHLALLARQSLIAG